MSNWSLASWPMVSLSVLSSYWALPFTLPILVYLVARWREPADPQLGIKAALSALRYVMFQVLLLGSAIAMAGAFSAEEPMARLGVGVILPSLLGLGVTHVALRGTDAAARPMVVRMMAGVSFVQSSLVAFGSAIALSMVVTAAYPEWSFVRIPLSVTLVYVPVALLQGWRLRRAAPDRTTH